jgi:hypothetical protein
MRALGVLVAVLSIAAFGARAEEAASACAHHKWSVEREAALLAHPREEAGSGAEWRAEEDGAFLLKLEALGEVVFQAPPEHAPSEPASSNGGVVRLTGLDSGLYEISLSEAAWIDVIQNGAFAKSEDHSSDPGCAIRKAVRFRLEAGEAVLQLSGAAASSIGVVVMRVE